MEPTTPKSIMEILTVIIALYGAILSSYSFYRSQTKLQIELLRDMITTDDKTLQTYIQIYNKNKEDIHLQGVFISNLGTKNVGFLIIPGNQMTIYSSSNQIYKANDFPSEKILKSITVRLADGSYHVKHFQNIFVRIYSLLKLKYFN